MGCQTQVCVWTIWRAYCSFNNFGPHPFSYLADLQMLSEDVGRQSHTRAGKPTAQLAPSVPRIFRTTALRTGKHQVLHAVGVHTPTAHIQHPHFHLSFVDSFPKHG